VIAQGSLEFGVLSFNKYLIQKSVAYLKESMNDNFVDLSDTEIFEFNLGT